MEKTHTHNVNINDMRRSNKVANDMLCRGVSKESVKYIFENYYRDQVGALYRVVKNGR